MSLKVIISAPSGPKSRWKMSAAAVAAPTVTASAPTSQKPAATIAESPTHSAAFIPPANRVNLRKTRSAAPRAAFDFSSISAARSPCIR